MQERASVRAWYALVAIIVVLLFAYVTRRILTLMADPIKADLSLSDLQIGETTGITPAIVAFVAMYPLAWLADRYERTTVLAICVIFWSIATALSGLAVDFTTLLSATLGIVIGEAALTPIIYSLIPDLFPAKSVPRANIIIYGATALGGGLTVALGGLLIGSIDDIRPLLPPDLSALEPWRLAFFLAAVPGPLVALGVFLIGRTRHTVVKNGEPAHKTPLGPYIKEHGLIALGVFSAMGLCNFALQALGDWLPVAIMRAFEVDAATIGIRFGLSFMAGAVVGLITASILTPFWRRLAGTAFVLRAISVSAIATTVPVILFGFATELWQAYALVGCWSAVFIIGVSLMPGLMQDIAPRAIRTRVVAGGTVVFLLLGGAGAPVAGFFSDQMPGNPKGLMWASISVCVTGLIACALLARFMERPYRRAIAAITAE